MSRAQVIFMVFRLTVWALALVAFDPRVLGFVGWDAGGRWLLAHGWLRWIALPVLAPLVLFSAFSVREVRQVGDDEPEDLERSLDPTLGIRESAVRRWPLEGHVVEAATWANGDERRCVARVTLSLAAPFAFSAQSAGSVPAWMQGAAQSILRAQVDQARARATGAEAQAWDAAAFLAEEPVDLRGCLAESHVVVRSNRPELARALFSEPEVARVAGELEEKKRRWQWSLLPTARTGEAELRFECRGRVENDEIAEGARTLMAVTLRHVGPTRAGSAGTQAGAA